MQLSAPDLEYECTACGAHPLTQVAVLTQRMLVNNWRNIAVFWLRLGMVGAWVDGWMGDPAPSRRGTGRHATTGIGFGNGWDVWGG